MRIPDAVHEELLNWSRWCWQGEWPHPLPRTHCGSMESQYRAPPYWNPDDEEMLPLPIRANERHAKVVQGVYDSLASTEQLVLKAEYPCRRDYAGRAAAARSLGLTLGTYEDVLTLAVRRVEGAFEVRA